MTMTEIIILGIAQWADNYITSNNFLRQKIVYVILKDLQAAS